MKHATLIGRKRRKSGKTEPCDSILPLLQSVRCFTVKIGDREGNKRKFPQIIDGFYLLQQGGIAFDDLFFFQSAGEIIDRIFPLPQQIIFAEFSVPTAVS